MLDLVIAARHDGGVQRIEEMSTTSLSSPGHPEEQLQMIESSQDQMRLILLDFVWFYVRLCFSCVLIIVIPF